MRRAPAVAALLLVSACAHDGRALRQPSSGQTLSIVTTTTGPTTTIGAKPAAGAATGSTTPGTTAGGAVASTAAGGSTAAAPAPGGPFELVLPWQDGAPIEISYTCNGGNNRPAISWSNVPAGTVELALLIEDDDADGFVHWLVAGLAPTVTSVSPGGLPPGGVQAINGFGNPGWGGPCPPAGSTHHYRTQLYALGAPSGITGGMATEAARAAVQKNIVGLATVTGVYGS